MRMDTNLPEALYDVLIALRLLEFGYQRVTLGFSHHRNALLAHLRSGPGAFLVFRPMQPGAEHIRVGVVHDESQS